jgi:anti-sigma factor RsiW
MHELDCATCHPLLDAYLDNELDDSSTRAVREHLAQCRECARRLEAMTALVTAVKAWAPRYAAPAALGEILRQPGPPSVARPSARWRLWLAPLLSATALAMAVVLYVATPASLPDWQDEAVSSHVRSLQAAHLNDVASSDRHTVKPWFTGKLDFAPPVYDFSAQGFPLLGGRLDYLQHQSAAALTYGHGRHIINLFILPTGQADSPLRTSSVRGFNIVSWRQGHLRFIAVSDMEPGELQSLGQLVSGGPPPIQ